MVGGGVSVRPTVFIAVKSEALPERPSDGSRLSMSQLGDLFLVRVEG